MAYAKKTWALDDPITDVALNNIETGVDTAHDVLDATGTPAGLSATTANAIGTATAKAKADHTHAISSNVTPTTLAAGASAAIGTSSHLARADHTHAFPATTLPSTQAIGASASVGTSEQAARADHRHAMPMFIQAGNFANAYLADGTTTLVLFPQAFASAPRVVVSLNENSHEVTLLVGNITKVGFTVRNAYQAGIVGFNWIAVLDPSEWLA